MLLVPKSVVARWSPFATQWIEAERLVQACLDDRPALTSGGLSLTRIDALGWRSEAARLLYDQACERLAQHCVDAGRYAHNVAVRQSLAGPDDEHLWLSTTGDRQRIAHPAGWPLLRRRFSARRAGFDARVRARQRYGELPSWSIRAAELNDGDAVLVTAPLCLAPTRAAGLEAFLCDYPGFVRTPADPRVLLTLSTGALRCLQTDLGAAAAWHPFARVLGIVDETPRGLRIDVLRLELRSPVPEARRYDHLPTWDEALIADAAAPGDDPRELAWAQKYLDDSRTSDRLDGLFSLPQTTPDPESRAELARRIALASREGDSRSVTRQSGTPYQGTDAFWCAVAALLPAWPDAFGLGPDKVEALLMAFDVAHGPTWQAAAGDPAMLGALRYTPAVMAEVRTRIAALAPARSPKEAGAFAL